MSEKTQVEVTPSQEVNGQPQRKRYSLVLKKYEFEVEVDGKVQTWFLMQMDSTQRDQWLNSQRDKVEVTGPNSARIKDFTNHQGALLSLCMYDHENKIVDPRRIAHLPSDMQEDLYEEAMKLSGLDKKAKEAAKNGLQATVSLG